MGEVYEEYIRKKHPRINIRNMLGEFPDLDISICYHNYNDEKIDTVYFNGSSYDDLCKETNINQKELEKAARAAERAEIKAEKMAAKELIKAEKKVARLAEKELKKSEKKAERLAAKELKKAALGLAKVTI